jgi:transcriptional regulator with XRE-family HTH domain
MDEKSASLPWFAENLRRAREAAGLTQHDLVRRVKADTGRPFSQQTYSKIENGTQEPVLSVAISLAHSVGADLDLLSAPPEQNRAALEIRDALRSIYDAHAAAVSAVTQFRYQRSKLLGIAEGHGAAGSDEVAAALALELDPEDT